MKVSLHNSCALYAFQLLLVGADARAATARTSLLSLTSGSDAASLQAARYGRLLQLRGGADDEDDEDDAEEDDDDEVALASKPKAAAVAPPAEAAGAEPSLLLKGLKAAIMPSLKVYAQAPPITRSWVSASVVLAVLTSTGALDTKAICMSEPAVLHAGEWWRMLVNFFFMGDALKSIFFWVQLHHFWDCCKMLEMVKYRWEPADFIKLIVCNALMLCVLKHHFFPHTIFLGSPMVMAFLYMYAREYEAQQMNLLGFFSIRCGWLPFAQMLQDILQAGDIAPNILGLSSGHIYYYFTEVSSRLLLPDAPKLAEVLDVVLKGKSIVEIPEEEEAAGKKEAKEGEADEDDDDGDDGENEDEVTEDEEVAAAAPAA